MNFSDIFVPALIVFILCYGLVKRVDIVNVFCEGAAENLKVAVGLIPPTRDKVSGLSRGVHTPCHSQTRFRERCTCLP